MTPTSLMGRLSDGSDGDDDDTTKYTLIQRLSVILDSAYHTDECSRVYFSVMFGFN